MLSRVSILSLVVTLSVLLFGECGLGVLSEEVARPVERAVEVTIVDADIPNPTSLLSGKDSSRLTTNSRRSMQRTSSRRIENAQFATLRREEASVAVLNSSNSIQSNILGGVVAGRAFYSLCCLRI